jgi:hypothetical protein
MCYGSDIKVHPTQKTHVLKAWSSACGSFRKQLVCEGSDLINGLIHWSIQNWIDYWDMVETEGRV